MADDDQHEWPAEPALSGGVPMSSGAPSHFAPDLLSRLTRTERKHVSGAYDRYLKKHGGLYWSASSQQETPRRMARKILGHGMRGAAWVRTAPVVIGLAFVIGACLDAASTVSIGIAVVLAGLATTLLLRMERRRRQVLGWFDEMYPG